MSEVYILSFPPVLAKELMDLTVVHGDFALEVGADALSRGGVSVLW